MRDKILSRLKEKFPGVNLSKKRLDAIADKLTPKITEESEIDAKLDELNELMSFEDIAKQDDKVRTLESKLREGNKPKGKEDENDESAKKAAEETPDWAKPLFQELASLRAEKTRSTMQQKITERMKDKDGKEIVPASYYAEWQIPEKEEDLEAFIEKATSRYTSFKQELVNQGLLAGEKPVNSTATTTTGEVSSMMKEYLDAKQTKK